MTIAAAAFLGILIGLSLGALGGGGSVLTVPALVYALGESAHAAATESLVIVGIAAAVAIVGHARARHIRWVPGITFGLIGICSSYAGTTLNRHIDQNALLLAFAVLMVIAATALLRRTRPAAPEPTPMLPLAPHIAAYTDPGDRGLSVEATAKNTGTAREGPGRAAVALKILVTGLIVGFITGFFGVGGGFLIVPALVTALGFEMPIAVGTSLLIIAITSAASLLARAANESLHWPVILPFTLAAITGSLAGKRLADTIPTHLLAKAFVTLLFAIAIYVATRSSIALTTQPS